MWPHCAAEGGRWLPVLLPAVLAGVGGGVGLGSGNRPNRADGPTRRFRLVVRTNSSSSGGSYRRIGKGGRRHEDRQVDGGRRNPGWAGCHGRAWSPGLQGGGR